MLLGEVSTEVGAGGCEETTGAGREGSSCCQGRMYPASRSKSNTSEAGQSATCYSGLCELSFVTKSCSYPHIFV